MPRETSHRLGDLQLRIMQVLWESGPSSVADVQARLGDDLAYTTVATMLRKMEDRGLVQHQEQDRKFLYDAVISADDVKHSMTSDLIEKLFAGSLSAAMSHLLERREVSDAELDGLERLIRDHRRKQ